MDVTVTVKAADGTTENVVVPVSILSAQTTAWGVYNGMGEPYDTGDAEFKALVGTSPHVGISYYSMADGQLPNAQETYRASVGTIPQISCESRSYKTSTLQWSWTDIAAGKYDSQYVKFAQGLAALNAPVMVCPDHEGDEQLNNKQRLSSGDTGAAYAQAWLHVQSVMAPVAPKIIWVWWMGGYSTTTMKSCYPGDSHVDLVGVDPYRSASHPPTETCAQTWNSRLTGLDTFVGASVPRSLTETGDDIPSAGTDAAVTWFDGVAARANQLGLVHVNLFNRNSGGNYKIDTYPTVVSAFQSQMTQMTGPFRLS